MKLDRMRQQSSYDHDTVLKGQKVLENLLVEGIEKCRVTGGVRLARRKTSTTSTASTTSVITTSTTSSTSESSYSVIVDSSIAESHQEEEEEEEVTECGERSGILSVGVTQLNEAGRDYNTRLCEAEAAAGGWTVGVSSMSLVIVCMTQIIA